MRIDEGLLGIKLLVACLVVCSAVSPIHSPPSASELSSYVGVFELKNVYGLLVTQRLGRLYATLEGEDGNLCEIAERYGSGVKFVSGFPADYLSRASQVRAFSSAWFSIATPIPGGLDIQSFGPEGEHYDDHFIRLARTPNVSEMKGHIPGGTIEERCVPD
jgi:hypothetical protein